MFLLCLWYNPFENMKNLLESPVHKHYLTPEQRQERGLRPKDAETDLTVPARERWMANTPPDSSWQLEG